MMAPRSMPSLTISVCTRMMSRSTLRDTFSRQLSSAHAGPLPVPRGPETPKRASAPCRRPSLRLAASLHTTKKNPPCKHPCPWKRRKIPRQANKKPGLPARPSGSPAARPCPAPPFSEACGDCKATPFDDPHQLPDVHGLGDVVVHARGPGASPGRRSWRGRSWPRWECTTWPPGCRRPGWPQPPLIPSMTGIWMSMRIRSKSCRLRRSMASWPFLAQDTAYPVCSSSSLPRQEIGLVVLGQQDPQGAPGRPPDCPARRAQPRH